MRLKWTGPPSSSRIRAYRGASVTYDRNGQIGRLDRRILDARASRVLPITADATVGSSNLATQPRAGNISSDTRAGIAG
jgi:hypothetical protein